MTPSNPRTLDVRAKANRVVEHHYDEEKPGKPLYLLVPGGLIAVATLLLIVFIAYRTWLDESLDPSTGLALILLLAPFYIGGVFLFSYGYELYDIPRALRDTAIIVFVTVASVVIVAVLFVVLGALGERSGSSSSQSSGKSKSSTASGSSGGGVSSSLGGGFGGGWGPVFIGSTAPTRVETREVVREVPVEPPKPQPITCPYCSRSYVPVDNKYACPSCGSATPEDLRVASEAALHPET